MSKARRIKQFIRITVISALTLYFGLIALISLPAVQHRISTYAARELSKLTQAEVRIGNVDLGLLNRVVIQNVQIKDRQGKDMLGISRFPSNWISLLSSRKKSVSAVYSYSDWMPT